MAYQIRELSIGEALDQAIAVLKNRLGLLLGIVICGGYLPLGLIAGLIQASYMPEVSPGATFEEQLAAGEATQEGLIYWLPILLVQTVIVLPITYGAIIHGIAKEYLQEPTSVGDSLRAGARRAIPLIWTFILYYIAVFGGMILCIIPGILFAMWLCLSPHVAVLEQQSGFAALKRSRGLTKGNLGKVLVLGFLLFVINFAAGLIVAFIPQPHTAIVVQVFAQAVSFILGTAAFVVLYFSCRSQHEGFDLQRLALAVRGEEGDTAGDPAPQF